MNNKELIEKIRQCRLADLSDGMDALGLVNTGTMSSKMRPIRREFQWQVLLIP